MSSKNKNSFALSYKEEIVNLQIAPVCVNCLYAAIDRYSGQGEPIWCAHLSETMPRPTEVSCINFAPSDLSKAIFAELKEETARMRATEAAPPLEIAPAPVPRSPTIPPGGAGAAPPPVSGSAPSHGAHAPAFEAPPALESFGLGVPPVPIEMMLDSNGNSIVEPISPGLCGHCVSLYSTTFRDKRTDKTGRFYRCSWGHEHFCDGASFFEKY